jgi:hypothetical protein
VRLDHDLVVAICLDGRLFAGGGRWGVDLKDGGGGECVCMYVLLG